MNLTNMHKAFGLMECIKLSPITIQNHNRPPHFSFGCSHTSGRQSFSFFGTTQTLLQTSLSVVAFTLVIVILSIFVQMALTLLQAAHSMTRTQDVEIASETKYYGPNQYTKSIEHVTSSKIVLAQGVLPSSNWTTYPCISTGII